MKRLLKACNEILVWILVLNFTWTTAFATQGEEAKLAKKSVAKAVEDLSPHNRITKELVNKLVMGRNQEDRKYLRSLAEKYKGQEFPRIILRNESSIEFNLDKKDYVLEVVDLKKGQYKISGCSFTFDRAKGLKTAEKEITAVLNKCSSKSAFMDLLLPRAQAVGLLLAVVAVVIVLAAVDGAYEIYKWNKDGGRFKPDYEEAARFNADCTRLENEFDADPRETFKAGLEETLKLHATAKNHIVAEKKKYCGVADVTVNNTVVTESAKKELCQRWSDANSCWEQFLGDELKLLDANAFRFNEGKKPFRFSDGSYDVNFTLDKDSKKEAELAAKEKAAKEAAANAEKGTVAPYRAGQEPKSAK